MSHPYLIPSQGPVQMPTFYPDASHYAIHQQPQVYGAGVGHMRDMTFTGTTYPENLRGLQPTIGPSNLPNLPNLPNLSVPSGNVNSGPITGSLGVPSSHSLLQNPSKPIIRVSDGATNNKQNKGGDVQAKSAKAEEKSEEEKAKIRKQQWFTTILMSLIVALTAYFMFTFVG